MPRYRNTEWQRKKKLYDFELRTGGVGSEGKLAVHFDKRGVAAIELAEDDRVALLLQSRGGESGVIATLPNEDFLHFIERYIEALKDAAALDPDMDSNACQDEVALMHLGRLKTLMKRIK